MSTLALESRHQRRMARSLHTTSHLGSSGTKKPLPAIAWAKRQRDSTDSRAPAKRGNNRKGEHPPQAEHPPKEEHPQKGNPPGGCKWGPKPLCEPSICAAQQDENTSLLSSPTRKFNGIHTWCHFLQQKKEVKQHKHMFRGRGAGTFSCPSMPAGCPEVTTGARCPGLEPTSLRLTESRLGHSGGRVSNPFGARNVEPQE
eukprot:4850358-Amphidinium_carterae.1